MSPDKMIVIGVAAVLILALLGAILHRLPRRLRAKYFLRKWRQLQAQLPDKQQWAQAIIEADKLLDEALKKRRIKGKTMGERLVNVQKQFSDNDAVWFGHKLSTKLKASPKTIVKKQQVKRALLGLRQGLKDLGAL